MKHLLLNNNTFRSQSLCRYFSFILKIDLYDITNVETDHFDENYIFIDEDFQVDEILMDSIYSKNNKIIIILGTRLNIDQNYINLLDLENLLDNFKRSLVPKNFISFPLLYLEGVKQHINRFVETHGEDSIRNCLNWTRYYLTNGPELVISQSIDADEYINNFYRIGIDYWNKFYEYYYLNEIYLKAVGFEQEASEISKNIEKFQRFVDSDYLADTQNIINTENSVSKDKLTMINNICGVIDTLSNKINNFYEKI